MQYLKTFESYNLETEYIKLYGRPNNEEEFEKMRKWLNKKKKINNSSGKEISKETIKKEKPGIEQSSDEVKRIANTGEHDRRLKTWESLSYKKQQLKQRWIEKNGVPESKEDMERMMYYIRKMMEQEEDAPLNTAGEMTRQIPSYSSKID